MQGQHRSAVTLCGLSSVLWWALFLWPPSTASCLELLRSYLKEPPWDVDLLNWNFFLQLPWFSWKRCFRWKFLWSCRNGQALCRWWCLLWGKEAEEQWAQGFPLLAAVGPCIIQESERQQILFHWANTCSFERLFFHADVEQEELLLSSLAVFLTGKRFSCQSSVGSYSSELLAHVLYGQRPTRILRNLFPGGYSGSQQGSLRISSQEGTVVPNMPHSAVLWCRELELPIVVCWVGPLLSLLSRFLQKWATSCWRRVLEPVGKSPGDRNGEGMLRSSLTTVVGKGCMACSAAKCRSVGWGMEKDGLKEGRGKAVCFFFFSGCLLLGLCCCVHI